MKFIVKANLGTWDDATYDWDETFEAESWEKAEEIALEKYLENDANCSHYTLTNLDTKECREYEEEIKVSQETIDRMNGILAGVIPDTYNEL